MLRLTINKKKFAAISGLMLVICAGLFYWGWREWQAQAGETAMYLLFGAGLGLVFFAIALFKGLRIPVLLEVDESGSGRVMVRQSPILPNRIGRFSNQQFRVDLRPFGRYGHTLNFLPPIETKIGEKVPYIYLSPKMVAGGPEHFQAVVDAINARAPAPKGENDA